MMIRIKQEDYDKIVDYAREGLPHEVCGLIAGRTENEVKTIEKVYLLTNIDKSAEHFTMDPKEQLAAVTDMRRQELSPLGNFHSHPATPARPSQEDIRLAYDRQASYLIISLAEAAPVLKAFSVEEGRVSEQKITIAD